jgi:iron complex transport system permease protein
VPTDTPSAPADSPVGNETTPGVVRAADRAYRVSLRALLVALALMAAAGVVSATRGAAGLPVTGVVSALLDALPGVSVDSGLTTSQEAILWSIRLPRTVLSMLVGAALGIAGAAYQGVFRNPLADPYLLGVSAGAGLGAVLALGFDLDLAFGPFSAVPAAAFAGALLAVSGSAVIARGSFASTATLLLSGVAMAALFSAAQTYALQQLDETRAREALSWLFGQLTTHGWDQVLLLLPYVAVSGLVLLAHARHLDVLRLGDDEATALGLTPTRVRLVVIVAATLMTAAAVSVSGLIAFVGLVVPHVVRMLTSHSYRVILPLSGVLGAAFLSSVDVGARTLVAPAELPVGVITAFVGAPFFAFVLWRRGGSR